MGSAIEWTEETWNPVVGCSKVSPGCANCYAETLHKTRLSGKGVYPVFKPWTPENAEHNVALARHRLDHPLRWSKSRMIFANSMSDLFHEHISDTYIVEVFAVMGLARQHTFQVLTKRPERMQALLSRVSFWHAVQTAAAVTRGAPYDRARRRVGPFERGGWDIHPLPNVWLGTSIENRHFVGRADYLRETPAAVRFISAEPLLGPLLADAHALNPADFPPGALMVTMPHDPRSRPVWNDGYEGPQLSLKGINWLIVGGESGGPTRRRLTEERADWIRGLRDYAEMMPTAFFFKQWGGPTAKAGGRELDGRTYDEYPVPPSQPVLC